MPHLCIRNIRIPLIRQILRRIPPPMSQLHRMYLKQRIEQPLHVQINYGFGPILGMTTQDRALVSERAKMDSRASSQVDRDGFHAQIPGFVFEVEGAGVQSVGAGVPVAGYVDPFGE